MSSLTILVALQTGALEVVHLWRFAGDGACGSCGRRTRGSASKVLVGAGSVSGVHRTGSFHRPFRTFLGDVGVHASRRPACREESVQPLIESERSEYSLVSAYALTQLATHLMSGPFFPNPAFRSHSVRVPSR